MSATLLALAATALALPDVRATTDGVLVIQPRHRIELTRAGVLVRPASGPRWRWRLRSAGPGVRLTDVRPRIERPGLVVYARGPVEEQYAVGSASVEQRFAIRSDLGLGGRDLLIEGEVESTGALAATDAGWRWSDGRGSVTLGDVSAWDANGARIPASMEVDGDRTLIRVDGRTLQRAAYPVLVDPEIGTDDFRISDMGPEGDNDFDAYSPDVAYNSRADEYLVVWRGNDGSGTLADDETEVFGQRIDARTGAEVGRNDFRISDVGADGDPMRHAWAPAVAYDSTNDRYLVVWWANDDLPGLALDEEEIYGQLIDATGNEVGPNDFRISDAGPDGNDGNLAWEPAVAYDSADDEYLVVWSANETGPIGNDEFEIYGQRIDAATGAEVGLNDFRISNMGPDGDTDYDTQDPALAYDPDRNEYLVVWTADDLQGALANNEFEVYGQRLDAATGTEVGADDFRISDVGPEGDPDYDAHDPAVAHNRSGGEYLVVWSADDDAGALAENESEIYGQRLDAATGAEVGANDFRISDMGPDGDTAFGAGGADVVHLERNGEYVVVWSGDDDVAPLVEGEGEVFGQRIDDATGLPIRTNDYRISAMGLDGSISWDAFEGAIACDPAGGECLVVWRASDDSLSFTEFEVFGQRILFCPSEVGASEVVRLGSPPNPNALLPGVSGGPVIGSTWEPVIDHTTFAPNAVRDLIRIAAQPANVSLPIGTLLCDPATTVAEVDTPPGVPFALPIPAACSLVGTSWCAQGASVDAAGSVALTNALDVGIGTF